jgi:tetratricopeptide (TPR) repeat protein
MFHFRGGEFKAAMQNATECRAIADTVEDPAAMALAHSILGRSLHIAGELDAARVELDALLAERPHAQRASTIYLGYDRHYRAEIALARTLWLEGWPDQAVQRADETLREAERMDRPESLTVVLAWAASVFLWIGDLHSAAQHVASSVLHAESQSLEPLMVLGQARRAELAIRRGDAEAGVESLQAALAKIETVNYELITTEFRISLIQGLAVVGRLAKARELSEEAIRTVETKGDLVYLPELLRVRAGLELTDDEAQRGLERSLTLSRRQGARSWELRAATDLAARLRARGRSDEARTLLQPVFEQFTEGRETADLKAAQLLLAASSTG